VITLLMTLKFDINPTKRVFYAACNFVFMYGSGVDEIALLGLCLQE